VYRKVRVGLFCYTRVLTRVFRRNSLGAVKAITAAQLALSAGGVYSVSLDEAIEAMRLTAADMSVKYKETSLSVRFCFPCISDAN